MNPPDLKKARNAEDDGGTEKPRGLLLRRPVPRLLKKSAGGKKCCIFRIPHRPEINNQNHYEPSVVSVGPYHYGKKHLQMIQEHKQGYLELFMAEAQKKDVEMKDLIEAVSLLEEDIMDSYSENLDLADGFDRNELIDMMILDGCFILMLLLVVAKEVQYAEYSEDPIFRMRWILPAIRKDLLLLENQVPFFVLQTIFDKSKIVTSCGLNKITFEFFACSIRKLVNFSLEHRNIKAKHLLDLIRKTLMPLKPTIKNHNSVSSPFLDLISSAKDLQLFGIIFRTRPEANTLLDVRINRRASELYVEIPSLVLDDFVVSIFRNCVAFEQFHGGCTNPITSYITFMGCLIRNEADAKILSGGGIIEKYFGTGKEIFEVFEDIGMDIAIDLHQSYLAEVFEGVNKYPTLGGSHIMKAILKHKYFNDPWAYHSFFSATCLFILAVLQVYLAAYAYIHPPKDK